MTYTETHKTCATCLEDLPHDRFGRTASPKGPKHGLRATCKKCEALKMMTLRRAAGVKVMPLTTLTSTHKTCTLCNELLTHESFGKNPTAKHGLTAACKTCTRARAIAKNYNLSPEGYEALMSAQDGSCATCGLKTAGHSRSDHLFVDHCHATGRVRGLLCHRCNTALGLTSDSPALLRSLATYLELSP